MSDSTLLKKRHSAENRFKIYGIASLLIALFFLVSFVYSIVRDAIPAFTQTEIQLEVNFDPSVIDLSAASNDEGRLRAIRGANYNMIIGEALKNALPDSEEDGYQLTNSLVSSSAQYRLMAQVEQDPGIVGSTQNVWLPSSGAVDSAFKGYVDQNKAEGDREVKDAEIAFVNTLDQQGRLRSSFNETMFSNGDSRSPQDAGIKGALIGSFYTLLVTLLLSFPIAVLAAVYLEEFASKNKFTEFLEANINNLAAVPSIVFGLLGLAVFISFFGIPRSTPLVGGLVLTLMTLPTIIISSRAALKSVPPSIRDAALGLGASKMQVVFHHVLPLALPGMLTGTIIGMAQALGETAPLLMIGMVAFIVDPANGILDPSTVMPVQIYIWSDLPDRAFVARTSFAIIILLCFLIVMNALAVLLRKKFERKW
ncbi:phosphate ABC transporter permease PstA [Suttonella sp. R2A3]|uniref:phosphate ABC transporter permease PstA n=1 Tax=Suttonella sp. R2A3 TaxID=2908648 RepID=UPI001F1FEFF8|nr:phosphate ABC transporter permease PstA [Suttonella sp. R2A3]UJF24796.1 phosphate ABC transporter permease PstA [Suttonella sp. R2A3]